MNIFLCNYTLRDLYLELRTLHTQPDSKVPAL
jgi:hypothetical protein